MTDTPDKLPALEAMAWMYEHNGSAVVRTFPASKFTVRGAKETPLTDMNRADEIISEKDAEIARMREALTPSGATKAAYHGDFSFSIDLWDDDAECEVSHKVYVPWDTVKQIMKAISERAALNEEG